MAYEFHYSRMVQWVDTDVGGIIHFSNYFRYMEEAETQFYRSLGVPWLTADGKIAFGPRVSVSCEFKKTVTFGDELDVHLWVVRKGRSSVGYEFSFLCRGEEVAHGRLTMACVKKDAQGHMKSTPIPKALDDAIEVAPFAAGDG